MDIKNLRIDYNKNNIDFSNICHDPITFFINWLNDALQMNTNDANACVLSTVSISNKPSSRVVLLKDVTQEGFVFFTNYNSLKAADIEKNKYVALNFYWKELERQVRVSGFAQKISKSDSDQYFKERPRLSQLSAWVSAQSKSISLDYNFNNDLDNIENSFKGVDIDRPVHWGGYCIAPERIEFWQGRPSRLHDRLVYVFDGKWVVERLAP